MSWHGGFALCKYFLHFPSQRHLYTILLGDSFFVKIKKKEKEKGSCFRYMHTHISSLWSKACINDQEPIMNRSWTDHRPCMLQFYIICMMHLFFLSRRPLVFVRAFSFFFFAVLLSVCFIYCVVCLLSTLRTCSVICAARALESLRVWM